jgi:hypothetical protein
MNPAMSDRPDRSLSAGLVRSLFTGSLDIVGDVHGEIDALRALLARLGYDEQGDHRQGRRLVFVGDLCDRGPDSLAVIRLVQQLVDAGLAQCVLGNHELNILRNERKHGNHWFHRDDDPKHEREFGPCVLAETHEVGAIRAFFEGLPVALEREDLRVVHAAWLNESIAHCCIRSEPALEAYESYDRLAAESDEGKQLRAARDEDVARHYKTLSDANQPPPLLRGIGAYDEHYQMSNPLRVITSGIERVTSRPFFAGGKWRFVERQPWWRTYRDSVPVVFGHYWRWWDQASHATLSKGEPNLFENDPPDGWQRNEDDTEVALCVDYSVGARFKERLSGKRPPFAGRLAALRWPERELVFDTAV